ncbi:hypothetical protein JL720_15113 [Aureococcus anophagefferens]|nr:hypothetical protein JL720_15113 [Aureococcus anophagefferens]
MKLHALGLQEYDAVLVVDNDFAPAGPWSDFGPLFDCAAEGRLLTTRASYSAVNGALVAAPPSAALLAELLGALATATACGACCGDSEEFFYGAKKKGKTCAALAAKEPGPREKVCKKKKGKKIDVKAKEACPAACGRCKCAKKKYADKCPRCGSCFLCRDDKKWRAKTDGLSCKRLAKKAGKRKDPAAYLKKLCKSRKGVDGAKMKVACPATCDALAETCDAPDETPTAAPTAAAANTTNTTAPAGAEAKVSTSLFMTGLSASDVNEDADVRAALKATIISLGGYDDVSNIVAESTSTRRRLQDTALTLKINFVAIIYADNVEAAAALAAAATAKIVAAVESDEFLPELKAQAAEVSVSVTIIFEAAGVDEEKTKDPDETDDDDDEPRAEYMTFDDGGGNKSPEAPGSDMGDDDDDDVLA